MHYWFGATHSCTSQLESGRIAMADCKPTRWWMWLLWLHNRVDCCKVSTSVHLLRQLYTGPPVADPGHLRLAGNNKEWQAQWVLIGWSLHGIADNSDVLSDLAYNMSGGTVENLWHGTAWPVISPKPVLLLPAEKTLQPGIPDGCNVFDLPNNRDCQNKVAACTEKKCVYPSLYVRYLQTLSSNVSMKVMPGAHSFPTDSYKETAAALLNKFAGV